MTSIPNGESPSWLDGLRSWWRGYEREPGRMPMATASTAYLQGEWFPRERRPKGGLIEYLFTEDDQIFLGTTTADDWHRDGTGRNPDVIKWRPLPD